MELMLVVYGVSLISNLSIVLGIIVAAIAVTSLIMWVRFTGCYSSEEKGYASDARAYTFWKTAAALVITIALIPSERTLQYMAGAYLIQSVYESTEAREIGNATKKAVMSQLEVWSKGNEQLITLIEQIKPAVQGKVHDYNTTGAPQ